MILGDCRLTGTTANLRRPHANYRNRADGNVANRLTTLTS
jgi:hypothetical protein